jgi:Family of unknown function (DUF5407)
VLDSLTMKQNPIRFALTLTTLLGLFTIPAAQAGDAAHTDSETLAAVEAQSSEIRTALREIHGDVANLYAAQSQWIAKLDSTDPHVIHEAHTQLKTINQALGAIHGFEGVVDEAVGTRSPGTHALMSARHPEAEAAAAASGFKYEDLYETVNAATAKVKAKMDEIRGRKDNISVVEMFEMQMLMNHLSQLSEMSTSVMSASNSAISSLARNVKD